MFALLENRFCNNRMYFFFSSFFVQKATVRTLLCDEYSVVEFFRTGVNKVTGVGRLSAVLALLNIYFQAIRRREMLFEFSFRDSSL